MKLALGLITVSKIFKGSRGKHWTGPVRRCEEFNPFVAEISQGLRQKLPNSAEQLASKSSFGECELYRSTAKHKLPSQDEAILAMEVPGQDPRALEADRKSTDGKAIVLPSASQMSMPREEEAPCHDFYFHHDHHVQIATKKTAN